MAQSAEPVRTASSGVTLLPWDPESTDHVERLYQQRIACGWNEQAVESWRGLQRQGKMAIQWVILSPADTNASAKLASHFERYPLERAPLQDTAVSLGAKARTATLSLFHTVGHISLDSEHTDATLANAAEALYCISTFYISYALQGSGLGRAAMDAVEKMAVEEPLCARTLTLNTVANEYEGKKEKWAAIKREPPKFSNQDWYARRGYVVYKFQDRLYWEVDADGRRWPSTAVFMKKTIR